MQVIISTLIGIILVVFLLLKYYPPFGKKSSKEKIAAFSQSPNFIHNKFVNQIPTSMDMNAKTLFSVLKDFIRGNPNGKPNWSIPVESLNTGNLEDEEKIKITWFGHSTVLLELEGKRVLLDPMFSQTPSPFPLFGGKRYSKILPSEIEKLPPIDLVLISHDHYDHLDYDSIMKLKDKVDQFCVPLGVGSHLEFWGVDKEKIREYDWWSEAQFDGLRLVAAPTRHFSGRGLFDRNTTLWCSWVIIGEHTKVYFSGDGGYGPHFKEIGEKYGPFDLTLMECGQYDKRWSAIHMIPEETAEAHLDLKGKIMIPIHWSAFSLALHDWTDPIERVTKAARKSQIDIFTPKIGETVMIGDKQHTNSIWWK